MQDAIVTYFKDCDRHNKPRTMSGLAIALDVSRMTLINYKNRSPEFSYTVRRARLFVELQYEEQLRTGTRGQVKGAIFALKANFGWRG